MKKYPITEGHRTKEVKIRSDRRCFFFEESGSGRFMDKGEKMMSVTILPSSPTGHLWDLEKPMTVWFCGECKVCHSKWGES